MCFKQKNVTQERRSEMHQGMKNKKGCALYKSEVSPLQIKKNKLKLKYVTTIIV